MATITNYLKQNGWKYTGDGHWYHAERKQTALDYVWAIYFELKINKEKTLEFLKSLNKIPPDIQKLMAGM